MRFMIAFTGTLTVNSAESLGQSLNELSSPVNGIHPTIQFTVTPLIPQPNMETR